jgi:hypothetical protein
MHRNKWLLDRSQIVPYRNECEFYFIMLNQTSGIFR